MKKIINEWNGFLREHKDDINSGAGILLFNKEGEVLLSMRSEIVSNPHTLGTIGGHLTKGEPPVVGAKREFYEESGYNGPFDKLKLLYIQRDESDFTYYSFIAYTDEPDQDFSPLPEFEEEIVWNRWFNFEEIKDEENLHPELKKLFQNEYVIQKIRSFIQEIP